MLGCLGHSGNSRIPHWSVYRNNAWHERISLPYTARNRLAVASREFHAGGSGECYCVWSCILGMYNGSIHPLDVSISYYRGHAQGTDRHTHLSEYYSEFVRRKASVIMRMVERLIGKENLLEVFLNLLSGVDSKVDDDDVEDTITLITRKQFRQMLQDRSQSKLVTRFYENWIDRPGYAHLRISFEYKKNENEIELTIRQDDNNFFKGQIVLGIQEVDAYQDKKITIQDSEDVLAIPLSSRNKKARRKKVKLSNDSLIDIDLSSEDLPDHPLLWITMDPGQDWYRKIEVSMEPAMWVFQATYDRNVTEQMRAIQQLAPIREKYSKLGHIAQPNSNNFWRVRAAAFFAVTARQRDHKAWNQIIDMFRKKYGLPLYPEIVRLNDFTNLDEYFMQQTIADAVSLLRDKEGFSPNIAHKFFRDLLGFNDNTGNPFDDSYYVGTLLKAFAQSVDLGVSKKPLAAHFRKDHRKRLNEVVSTLSRYMNLDKLNPSFHFHITKSCLQALWKLQKSKTIPRQIRIFHEHAMYGHFEGVRLAAVEILIDALASDESTQVEVDFVLNIAEHDGSLNMRYHTMKLLTEYAPFHVDRKDSGINVSSVVDRLWEIMNAGTAYDAKNRLCALEFFETILPSEEKVATIGIPTLKIPSAAVALAAQPTVRVMHWWNVISLKGKLLVHAVFLFWSRLLVNNRRRMSSTLHRQTTTLRSA
eukprot:m.829321 g.829321  ORF g.829321 m.829321 type:complete len:702 (-) comp23423_c0_seq34:1769-3874(-)